MQILKLTDEAFGTILTNMLKRSPDSYPEQEAVVSVILADVRENGDKAVFNYTKKFDGIQKNLTGRIFPRRISSLRRKRKRRPMKRSIPL